MARTSITITQLTRAGVAPAAQVSALAADGLELPATVDQNVFVEIENTDIAQQTATFLTVGSSDGFDLADHPIVLAAGAKKVMKLAGSFGIESFVQAADGKVYIDVSVDSTIKFRAFRL